MSYSKRQLEAQTSEARERPYRTTVGSKWQSNPNPNPNPNPDPNPNPNPNTHPNPNPNPNTHPHPHPNPSQVGSKWQSTVLGHFKHPEAGALHRARWLAEHYTTEPPPPPPPPQQQQQHEEPAQASGSESDPPTKKRRLSSQHLKWTPKGNPMHGDGSPRAASPALTASPAEEEATLNSTLPPAAMVAPAAALPPRAPASAYAEDTIKVGCNHRHGRLQP